MVDLGLDILAAFKCFSLLSVLFLRKESGGGFGRVGSFADLLSGVDCWFDVDKRRVVVGH